MEQVIPEVILLKEIRDRLFISDPVIPMPIAEWIENMLAYAYSAPLVYAPRPQEHVYRNVRTPWFSPTLRVIGCTPDVTAPMQVGDFSNGGVYVGSPIIKYPTGLVFITADTVTMKMVTGEITSKQYILNRNRWSFVEHGVMKISDYLIHDFGGDAIQLDILASLFLINQSVFSRFCAMVTDSYLNYQYLVNSGKMYEVPLHNRPKEPPQYPYILSDTQTQASLF